MATNATVEMALGRIFSMMMRPEQPGDGDTYEACRLVILNELSGEFGELPMAYRPSYASDRNRGAQGDSR